jgi:hypothetical protein
MDDSRCQKYDRSFPSEAQANPDFSFAASCSSQYCAAGISTAFKRRQSRTPICIAEGDEPKLCRGIQDQILCDSTHVGHGETGPHHELNDKVAIADPVQTVPSQRLETELFSQEFPIDYERIPCECSRSKGKN